jgi:hypothetical protein
VQLYEVETVRAEPAERPIDNRTNMGASEGCELVEIGHALGVDLDCRKRGRAVTQCVFGTEGTEELFDAGVDIGTIECIDARLATGDEIGNGSGPIDRPVPTCQLPAPADHPGNFVVGGDTETRRRHDFGRPASGVAVVSARLNDRLPILTIRKRHEQLGSGQATSSSVDIQSLGSAERCLAGSSGRRAARE